MPNKKNIVLCILGLIIVMVIFFPVYWIVNTSLKTEQEIFLNPPTLYPQKLNTDSYMAQIAQGDFNMFRSFFNSMVIAVGALVVAVILAVPASYGIARYAFRGRQAVVLIFLITQMLPVSVLLTPVFIIFKNLKLLNTPWSAIIADATIGIPFSILILKNYFAAKVRFGSAVARHR